MSDIKFGTYGWRGRIGRTITHMPTYAVPPRDMQPICSPWATIGR